MDIIEHQFDQEYTYKVDKKEILEVWKCLFGDNQVGNPTKWSHFVELLKALVETRSTEKLIEALELRKFCETLKFLYKEIIKEYNN